MVLKVLQVPLERIGIDEEVRRLDQEQLRVDVEIADRLDQEAARRGVVGVEDDDEVALRMSRPLLRLPALACTLRLRVR